MQGLVISGSWPPELGAQCRLHDRFLPLTSHVRTTTILFLPVGWMFRSVERISVQFNSKSHLMSYFWIRGFGLLGCQILFKKLLFSKLNWGFFPLTFLPRPLSPWDPSFQGLQEESNLTQGLAPSQDPLMALAPSSDPSPLKGAVFPGSRRHAAPRQATPHRTTPRHRSGEGFHVNSSWVIGFLRNSTACVHLWFAASLQSSFRSGISFKKWNPHMGCTFYWFAVALLCSLMAASGIIGWINMCWPPETWLAQKLLAKVKASGLIASFFRDTNWSFEKFKNGTGRCLAWWLNLRMICWSNMCWQPDTWLLQKILAKAKAFGGIAS